MLETCALFVGIGALYFGAEWLVRGAASLALHAGIRPLVVGLTIVALGTSMPEFLVNIVAAWQGGDELAIGNIVGSNVANIALILGTSLIIYPLIISKPLLKREYPAMLGVMIWFYLVCLDKTITQLEGAFLLAGLFVFLYYLYWDSKKNPIQSDDQVSEVREEDLDVSNWKRAGWIVGGIIILSGGARLFVYGGEYVGRALGFSELAIGLFVLAIGTSLPELATSVVSAMHKESDISLGNVLGSNVFNVLFVVGSVALIQPLAIEDPTTLSFHFPVMIGFAVLLLVLSLFRFRLTRWEGSFLLLCFFAYIFYTLLKQ